MKTKPISFALFFFLTLIFTVGCNHEIESISQRITRSTEVAQKKIKNNRIQEINIYELTSRTEIDVYFTHEQKLYVYRCIDNNCSFDQTDHGIRNSSTLGLSDFIPYEEAVAIAKQTEFSPSNPFNTTGILYDATYDSEFTTKSVWIISFYSKEGVRQTLDVIIDASTGKILKIVNNYLPN